MKSTFTFLIALVLVQFLNALSLKSYAGTTVPTPDHVVVVIMENHSYSEIIGSSAAPHINALATDSFSASFTQSYAIEHPSQPNYLDFYSGCNQGVTDDNVPANNPFTTANLGRQLIDAGKTFVTYSENLPSVGYNGASSGNYARKHNPAANWMGTGTNQIATTTNQPFTAFPSSSNYASLPTVCYVVPNQINDMHSGTITAGDTWVYTYLNNYIQWAKTHNSLLILTFDEDDATLGNRIATIFCGEMVKAGQYTEHINHYSVLRTIEAMYSLNYICNAATSTTITDVWLAPNAVNPVSQTDQKSFIVYPNPLSDESIIRYHLDKKENVNLDVYDLLGNKVYAFINQSEEQGAGNYEYRFSAQQANINAGVYFIKLSAGNESVVEKILVVE